MSKAKYLKKTFGGNWKYDGMSTWWCDDGVRYVVRTASNFYDDSDNSRRPPTYYLYGEGTPKIVGFNTKTLLFWRNL